MGKSNTIEKQQKSNQAFMQYVDEMQADLGERLGKSKADLKEMITEHYVQFGDDTSLLYGEFRHLATVSEWSLGAVTQMIDACRNAILGGSLPQGTHRDDPKPDVTQAIAGMKNLDLLIANAAFDAVQGLLVSMTSRSTTSISAKTDIKPLTTGLTLFITVMENAYSRKDFFNSESIIQNLFVFDARFSIEEGKAQSRMSDLQLYEEQKIAFRKKVEQLDAEVAKLEVGDDLDAYLRRLQALSDAAERIHAMIDPIDRKMAELGKPKLAQAAIADGDKWGEIVRRLADRNAQARATLLEATVD